MRKLRRPFFGVNPKSYLFGDALIDLAKYTDELAGKYDVDITFSAPYADLARLAKETKNLFVTAQGIDGIMPGRGMGLILPESLKEAGVEAVIMNHAERPMTISNLVRSIYRCKELGLITIVCTDTLEEAKMIATLHPNVMICEQTSLIGTGVTADDDYILSTNDAVKSISPETLVIQGAGIRTGADRHHTFLPSDHRRSQVSQYHLHT